jgi:hypothetical protein
MQLEEEDTPVFSLSAAAEAAKDDAREATDSNSEISSEPLEPGEETQSQVHVFRIPLAIQEEIIGAGFLLPDDLPQPPVENESAGIEDSLIEIHSPLPDAPRQAKCPMCYGAIDAEFIKNYNNGK